MATQEFSRSMAERGAGVVINISSMTAFTPLTKVAAYSAAKAAVNSFTEWLAVHLAGTGVLRLYGVGQLKGTLRVWRFLLRMDAWR